MLEPHMVAVPVEITSTIVKPDSTEGILCSSAACVGVLYVCTGCVSLTSVRFTGNKPHSQWEAQSVLL